MATYPTLIVHNAKIHTGTANRPEVQALAAAGRRIVAVGTNGQIRSLAGPATVVIDARRRRVIPGLIDACQHLVSAGVNYNQTLHWDGVPSLAQAMRMLAEQVQRTPAPQWVRVTGGFCERQFAEQRLPTLDELNAVAPSTPVYIQHMEDRALLNTAALAACGYDDGTPDPHDGHIAWDDAGRPTGLLIATPGNAVFRDALSHAPVLPHEYRINSTRQYMRELNRLGVTSVIDAGVHDLNYPDDYRAIEELALHHLLTVRVAWHLAAQTPGNEVSDFLHWCTINRPGDGDELFRFNGAGDVLVHAANDMANFRQPRPELSPQVAVELEDVVRRLVARRWPWRMQATYDETTSMALDVFERVHATQAWDALRWFFDGADMLSERGIERVAHLQGGIVLRPTMAWQGEDFVASHGAGTTAHAPPIARLLASGVHVGVGSGAPGLASVDPWQTLQWLVTGTSIAGHAMQSPNGRLDRATALALHTRANSWFTHEEDSKGQLDVGQYADLALLSEDYFDVSDDDIRHIEAELTVMDGRVVYARGDYQSLDLPAPAPLPEWSPGSVFHACWKPAHAMDEALSSNDNGNRASV